MKYCPNTACKYRLKHGRAAEFIDRAVCTECGTLLSSVAPAPATAPARLVAPGNDAAARLAVTLGASALVLIGLRLPLLGAAPSVFDGRSTVEGTKLLAFGLVPFFAGFVTVELFAMLFPGLRARRVGGARARAPLDLASLVVSGLFLALQIHTLVLYSRSSEQLGFDPSGGPALPPLPLLWAQLLGAHFGLVALARFVTRRGLGNGFAVITVVALLSSLSASGGRVYSLMLQEAVTPATLLLVLLGGGGALWAVVRLSRATRPTGGAEGPTVAPFPISGLMWSFGALAVSLPATLAAFVPAFSSVAGALQSSTALYTGLMTFANLDAALLFGWLFFRPRAVGRLWARWVKGVDETSVVVRARALLPRAMLLAVGVVCGAPLLMTLGARVISLPPMNGLIELVAAALILLDLAEEWRARRAHGALVVVAELNRVAEVEPVLFVLRAKGIACHPRTLAWRASLQFFGPFAPVQVLVPPAQAEAAAAALLEDGARAA